VAGSPGKNRRVKKMKTEIITKFKATPASLRAM
jgi:hypothetical protein